MSQPRRLRRLLDDSASGSAFERRAAELLRFDPPPPLGLTRQARIAARIRQRVGAPPRFASRWVVVTASVLFGGAVAAAVGAPSSPLRALLLPSPVPPPSRAASTRRAPASRADRVPLPIAIESAPSTSDSLALSPVVQLPRRRSAPSPAAEAGSGLGAEAQLLAEAIARLRRDKDPGATLKTLKEYRRRYPDGALSLEASMAEADALLAVDRRSDALRALESLPARVVEQRPTIALARGELRAEAGSCGTAMVDFDTVLAAAYEPAVAHRALFGRAACRLRGGDTSGGRADLERYLSLYPNGQFARRCREWLGRP